MAQRVFRVARRGEPVRHRPGLATALPDSVALVNTRKWLVTILSAVALATILALPSDLSSGTSQRSATPDGSRASPARIYFDTGDNQLSGYVVGSGSGNGFKTAEGNWNIPCSSPPFDSNHQAAFWVGIGGWFGSNLLQTGIALRADGHFYLFREAYPNGPVFVALNSSGRCGDHMYARASYKNARDNANGAFTIVEDLTTGQALYGLGSDYGSFRPDIQSADWFDERPGCANFNYTDLANFHYTQWSNALATANYTGATPTPISHFTNQLVYDYDANKVIGQTGYIVAEPTVLNGDGKSYTDYWYDPGTDGHC